MEQKMIKAVEMTRKIRDTYADELQGKSQAEIIAFYQQKAQELHKKLNLPMPPQQAVEGPKTTA
jgi:hypothetical protein